MNLLKSLSYWEKLRREPSQSAVCGSIREGISGGGSYEIKREDSPTHLKSENSDKSALKAAISEVVDELCDGNFIFKGKTSVHHNFSFCKVTILGGWTNMNNFIMFFKNVAVQQESY